jgi:hypothetical protein
LIFPKDIDRFVQLGAVSGGTLIALSFLGWLDPTKAVCAISGNL